MLRQKKTVDNFNTNSLGTSSTDVNDLLAAAYFVDYDDKEFTRIVNVDTDKGLIKYEYISEWYFLNYNVPDYAFQATHSSKTSGYFQNI